MNNMPCPGDEQLREYAVGRLDEGPSEALEGHVAECAACQARFATIGDIEDTLALRLRRAPAADEYQDEPAYHEAEARAKALVETAVTLALSDTGDQPSGSADLGRLGE
jgi:anti-sigma factor RsiW